MSLATKTTAGGGWGGIFHRTALEGAGEQETDRVEREAHRLKATAISWYQTWEEERTQLYLIVATHCHGACDQKDSSPSPSHWSYKHWHPFWHEVEVGPLHNLQTGLFALIKQSKINREDFEAHQDWVTKSVYAAIWVNWTFNFLWHKLTCYSSAVPKEGSAAQITDKYEENMS